MYDPDRKRPWSVQELRAEIDSMRTEARDLITRADGDNLNPDDSDKFSELASNIEAAQTALTEAEASIEKLRGVTDPGRIDGAKISNRSGDTDSTRSAAMRMLDNSVKRNTLGANQAETVEKLMTSGHGSQRTWTERWALATGNPAYESAFLKAVADPQRGHMSFTEDEARAWRAVQSVDQEQRAVGLGSQGGDTMVPLALDPAIILSNDGSNNPLRKISRVVTTASDSWNGVVSAGATAEWRDEFEESTDGSPTLTQPSIPVHRYSVWAPYSIEWEGDSASGIQELSKVIRDAADHHQASAFTTGTGTGEPTGIITALAASSPTVIVTGGGSEVLDKGDLVKLQNALGARFQPNASFVAHLATWNTFRFYETTNGALLFPSLQNTPASVLGRPVHENSHMDSTVNPAATAANYLIVYGDHSNFVIADRVGTKIELIPHIMGSNQRPTGQRGLFLWGRTGSDVVVDNAFRVLNVATAA